MSNLRQMSLLSPKTSKGCHFSYIDVRKSNLVAEMFCNDIRISPNFKKTPQKNAPC